MALLLLLATMLAALSAAGLVAFSSQRRSRHNSLRADGETPVEESRWQAAAVPAGAAILGVVTLALVAGRPGQTVRSTSPGRIAAPLELLSLGAERDGQALTIHGVIRNPSRSAGVANVEAVVLLYSEQGAFLASGRAVVDTEALGPGRQSQFAVTIPGAGSAGRYRVSFRSDDHLLTHVDRRAS
jgi:hypothetical protein